MPTAERYDAIVIGTRSAAEAIALDVLKLKRAGVTVGSRGQIAMMGGIPTTALRDAVFAHPTLAESLNNLFAELEAPSTSARE